jgi:hypothetical protein
LPSTCVSLTLQVCATFAAGAHASTRIELWLNMY